MGDRREALEAAFDAAEVEDTETIVAEGSENETLEKGAEGTTGEGEPKQTPEEKEGLAAGKAGKEKEKAPPADALAPDKKGQQAPKKGDPALERAAQASAGSDNTKAPISWKGAAKEAWAKLPVDVKQEVIRREKEMNQYISQNDHHRKFTEGFGQVVRPFMPLIQAQGSTPLQAVRNMMVTAAGLTTGTQEQKARIIAEIIGNYNVDVEALDKVLAGGGHQVQNRGQGVVDPNLMRMLQPIQGFMSEVQQAREMRAQRQQQEAEELIEQNADKPFFDDLTDDMADIMEIAAKRGQELTLDQAYEKALALNPDLAKIVAQQKAQEEARANGGTRLARARRASSTLTGAPAGGGDLRGTPKNRREALEAAWDDSATQ